MKRREAFIVVLGDVYPVRVTGRVRRKGRRMLRLLVGDDLTTWSIEWPEAQTYASKEEAQRNVRDDDEEG